LDIDGVFEFNLAYLLGYFLEIKLSIFCDEISQLISDTPNFYSLEIERKKRNNSQTFHFEESMLENNLVLSSGRYSRFEGGRFGSLPLHVGSIDEIPSVAWEIAIQKWHE
jgi:hypothetical protein